MVDPDRDATGDEAPAAEGPTRVVEAVGAPQAESFEALEGFQRDEETSAPTTPRASAEHRRDAAIGRGVFEDDVDSSDADDAAAGDVALRKVVVVSSEAGVASGDHKDEGKSKVATAEDDEDYCRICMDPVTSDHLARGDATHLGCACVGGYMHRACAVDFVVKKNTAVMLCEVCLEEMVGLEVIAAELREERRAAHRARVTVMTLNGVPPEGARDVPDAATARSTTTTTTTTTTSGPTRDSTRRAGAVGTRSCGFSGSSRDPSPSRFGCVFRCPNAREPCPVFHLPDAHRTRVSAARLDSPSSLSDARLCPFLARALRQLCLALPRGVPWLIVLTVLAFWIIAVHSSFGSW